MFDSDTVKSLSKSPPILMIDCRFIFIYFLLLRATPVYSLNKCFLYCIQRIFAYNTSVLLIGPNWFRLKYWLLCYWSLLRFVFIHSPKCPYANRQKKTNICVCTVDPLYVSKPYYVWVSIT